MQPEMSLLLKILLCARIEGDLILQRSSARGKDLVCSACNLCLKPVIEFLSSDEVFTAEKQS